MSLVPMLFSNWWEDLDHPHHIFDQDFGVGLNYDQLMTPQLLQRYLTPRERRVMLRPSANYNRPWAELLRSADAAVSTVKPDKDKFQVILDVQQFKPEEINVKVVDKFVSVEAKHEEKQDEHGWISRQFHRKYMIPEQCDLDKVSSSLSSDGVLTITAPKKAELAVENGRTITIEHTGKPAIRPRDGPVEDEKECKRPKRETVQKTGKK